MRAHQKRNREQKEAVDRHAPGKRRAFRTRVPARQREEDRAASQRVHHRKQRADKENCALQGFEHVGSTPGVAVAS